MTELRLLGFETITVRDPSRLVSGQVLVLHSDGKRRRVVVQAVSGSTVMIAPWPWWRRVWRAIRRFFS